MEEKKPSVLIVDDQLGVRRLLEEALGQMGYETHLAANGQEALWEMESRKFSLVILDMKMPGMNGLEVLQEMASRSIRIPTVLMTAYSELDMIAEGKALGVVEYMAKPFDINQLWSTIERLLKASEDDTGEVFYSATGEQNR